MDRKSGIRPSRVTLALVMGLLLGGPAWVGAQSMKIGVVDPQVVMDKSLVGHEALKVFQEDASVRKRLLAREEEELRLLEHDLRDHGDELTEEEKTFKREQFRERYQTFQHRVQEFNQEMAARQQELQQEYMHKIEKAVQEVAAKRGLTMVVHTGDSESINIVIYRDPALDITEAVIREFDRLYHHED